MARASADVQTDINSTSQKIDTLDTEIADCNQKKQNLIDKYDNLKDQKKKAERQQKGSYLHRSSSLHAFLHG